MKRIYKTLIFSVLCLYSITFMSCSDFDNLNIDTSKADKINPNYQLTLIQLQTWGSWQLCQTYTQYLYAFTQQLMGSWGTTNYGGQYRQDFSEMSNTWNMMYPYTIKNIVDIIDYTKDDPSHININSAARIYKVYLFGILTYLYGDIPYFDAAKGYIDMNAMPAYDEQEFIYKDFMKELSEAVDSLNQTADNLSGDVIFNGDINKWKRFANSLHLRYAMRMVNADPLLAKEECLKAITHEAGLMQSGNDDALIPYLEYYNWDNDEYRRNGQAQHWIGREDDPTPFICSVFWNQLGDTQDPRQFIYGRCYAAGTSANNPFGRIDLTDEMLDIINSGAANPPAFHPNDPGYYRWEQWPSEGCYWSSLVQAYQQSGHPEVNPWMMTETRPQVNNIFLRGTAPGVVMTYAEVELLLAECKVRWGLDALTGSDAAIHYANGVRAAMRFLEKYGAPSIDDALIESYLRNNSFPTTFEDRLKAINTQAWILHFNNAPEAWANVRRSGYPVLLPTKAYGVATIDSQIIPTRLCYPLFEDSYNPMGYNSAIARMGGIDDWNATVWWNK